ncbi:MULTISPECIES: hypothetical protein [Levilactobacillus]|uniref:hypothetical protein n=1 Tax=Levilactobacillus TaxID=2767886 RepID=UPI0013DDD2D9|nr:MULTISPECIES: hypothetical protein [Levilactobacillus]
MKRFLRGVLTGLLVVAVLVDGVTLLREAKSSATAVINDRVPVTLLYTNGGRAK